MKRAALVSILALLVAVLAFRAALQHPWVLDRIRGYAEASVPGLRIDRVDGDAWNDLRLTGLTYRDETTTARIDTLEIRYSVWALATGKIDIHRVDVRGPRIELRPDSARPAGSEPFTWPDLTADAAVIHVRNGSISWDGTRYVDALAIDGSAGYADRTPRIRIDSLSFRPAGLPVDGVQAELSGTATSRRVDLSRLLLATSRSVLRSSGHFGIDSGAIQATASATPLAWQDLLAVAGRQPIRQDLDVRLDLAGTAHQLQMSVMTSGPGVSNLDVDIVGRILPAPSIRELRVRGRDIDLSRLLSDGTLPSVGSLTAYADGWLPLDQPDSMAVHGVIQAESILVQGQRIRRAEATVSILPDSIRGEGSVTIGQAPIRFAATTDGLSPEARFRLSLDTRGFDLRAIRGFEALPSELNAVIEASGVAGAVRASVRLRPSTLNRATIEDFRSNLAVDGDVVTITEATIRSAIIEGRLTGRFDRADPTDPENRLDAGFQILDLQPLASFLGVDTLRADGSFNASMGRTRAGILRLVADAHITGAQIDEVRTGPVAGQFLVELVDNPTLDLRIRVQDIDIRHPIAKDLDLRLMANRGPDSTTATYRLYAELIRPVTIRHEGEAVARNTDDIRLTGTRLDLRLADETYQLAQPFHAAYHESDWRMDGLVLAGASGVQAELHASRDGAAYQASGRIRQADLSHLRAILDTELDLTGRADLRFTAAYAEGQPSMDADLDLRSLVLNGLDVDSLSASARLDAGRLSGSATATRRAADWLDLAFSVPFRFDAPDLDDGFFREEVTGQVRILPTNLADLAPFMRSLGLDLLSGTVSTDARMRGTAGQPLFDGRLDLLRGALAGVPVDSAGFVWAYDGDASEIRMESEWRSLGQTALQANGTLPFQLDMRTFTALDVQDEPVRLALATRDFNLAAVNAFADPSIARRIAGRMSGDIRIGGILSDPQVEGGLNLSGGSVFLPDRNITVGDIALETRFRPGRIDLVRLQAQSNGRMNANGWISLDGIDPVDMDVTVTGRNVRVSDTRDLQLFASMDARLSGRPDSARAGGTLTLERGAIYLDGFGEPDFEDVSLAEDGPAEPEEADPIRNLAVEMRIRTEQNVWLRNRSAPEMQLELKGDLDVVKEPGGDWLVFGTMGSRQGHLTQLGKRFDMETGELVFSGEAENPAMRIRAAYKLRPPNDITVWYSIGGTLDEPTFTYESEPQMELQDMVSYTLFNRPFNALMSWEQSMTSQGSVGSMAVDLLADRVGDLAAGALGLDVVQIDNSRVSGNSGMTVKAGKYVNDRLFIAILQEFGGTSDSQVIMEYALRQNLNVVLTGSDRRKSGIDIQWKYDY